MPEDWRKENVTMEVSVYRKSWKGLCRLERIELKFLCVFNGMLEQRGDAAWRNPCISDSCQVGAVLVRQINDFFGQAKLNVKMDKLIFGLAAFTSSCGPDTLCIYFCLYPS